MARREFNLPSLNMLGTFEGAARCGSFKEAANLLGVTPGAVSHQIRALEEDLGVALFFRSHKNVVLTEAGQNLFLGVTRGLDEMATAVRQLRQEAETEFVSIGATTAFSSLILTPALSKFWREHGDLQIRQEVRDRPFSRPFKQDLVIEYRVSATDDGAEVLFEDDLLPLCSPEFKGRNIRGIDALANSALIHMDASERSWTSWANWFSELGYSGPLVSQHRVNNYAIALQLAQEGSGIVLGWKKLVGSLIAEKKLVPCTELEIKAPGKFYLAQAEKSSKPNVTALRKWLMNEFE